MKFIHMLCLSILGLAACKPAAEETHSPHSEHSSKTHSDAIDHSQHQSLEASEASDHSLFHVESNWQTQTGKSLKLKDLAGKPIVLAMVYASCKNACPRIIADMKRIQSDSSKSTPADTHFVLVSIDPEVDTPERLAELARKSQLNQQWILLRSDADNVMELAALLGVKYRKISDKDYAHTNLISVLNAKGEIVHRQQGLGVEPTETLAALERLQSKH